MKRSRKTRGNNNRTINTRKKIKREWNRRKIIKRRGMNRRTRFFFFLINEEKEEKWKTKMASSRQTNVLESGEPRRIWRSGDPRSPSRSHPIGPPRSRDPHADTAQRRPTQSTVLFPFPSTRTIKIEKRINSGTNSSKKSSTRQQLVPFLLWECFRLYYSLCSLNRWPILVSGFKRAVDSHWFEPTREHDA